ncbi:E3 ubiquitin-protein ligase goliath isoform X2 [Onthophagus taurus]|uniref:E3 ubiquitin-protein ligase goliath isoform X2 n=1 Tax=Onthophagus taurus TaxID=166361 RepID=UPI000C20B8C0|nr:protein goliath isoform X2 [Onthophagus taurus]
MTILAQFYFKTILVFVIILKFSRLIVSTSVPEDWPHISILDDRYNIAINAFINLTQLVDDNKWVQIGGVEEHGRFGTGHVGPTFGQLVHIKSAEDNKDHTACTLPLLNSNSFYGAFPNKPWIALISRGGCNFDKKIVNAYEIGARGVIIYNNVEKEVLEVMSLSHNKNISAIFTFKWKGEQMASYLENNSQVYVHITVGSTQPLRNGAINRTSVLFVSTTFIVLMIISLAWLIFYYVQRFRHIHAKDKLSKRLSSAAKKALSKIPTKTIKCEDKEVKEGECCAVCIEPYKSCEILRILPCSHEFHKGCIDPWLLEHRTCPMCKMDILKRYGFVFSGSQESILQIDPDDIASLDAPEESVRHGSTTNGVSPLPQIRAEIQFSYDSSNDENCSRASTPNELTPSLGQSGPKYTPVPSQFCLNCRGATTTNVLVNNKDIEIDMEEGSSNITKEIIKENVDNQ